MRDMSGSFGVSAKCHAGLRKTWTRAASPTVESTAGDPLVQSKCPEWVKHFQSVRGLQEDEVAKTSLMTYQEEDIGSSRCGDSSPSLDLYCLISGVC